VLIADVLVADGVPSSRPPPCLLPDALADDSLWIGRDSSCAKGSGSRCPLRRTSRIRFLGVGICWRQTGWGGSRACRPKLNDRPSLLLTWAMSLPHETFKCDACSAQARAESLCTSPRVEAAPFDARSLPEGACSSVQARPLPGTTRSTQAHNRRQQKGARGGSQPWAAEASERRPAASLRCQPQADLGQTGVRRGRKNLRCRAAPRCALARKWSVRVRHAHLRACRPIRPGCRCAPVVRCECRQRGPEPACSPMVAPRVAAAAPLTPASWSRSFTSGTGPRGHDVRT